MALLNEQEQQEVIRYLEADKPLPDKYRFLLFGDKREVELVWNGKTNEVCKVVLPFQTIEQVDEPRAEADIAQQGDLFDPATGRQLKGWTNKLIWGDNKFILSSLKSGGLRDEIERNGGVKLIYIDPPFDIQADFSMKIEVGEDRHEFTKEPNILEQIAYRDTWGKGQDSFLAMIYERLTLMRDLLADDGHFVIHCDQRLSAHLKFALCEVFGQQNFRNEIVWLRSNSGKTVSQNFARDTDHLLWFTKSDSYHFAEVFKPLSEDTIQGYKLDDNDGRGKYTTVSLQKTAKPGPLTTYDYVDNNGKTWNCPTKGWRMREEKLRSLENDGRIHFGKTTIREKSYWNERKSDGKTANNLWEDIPNLQGRSEEITGYPTQKPSKLIERILEAFTSRGDIVCDFFVGSGTTAAVAEKLGRKWIASDLGKFAIHTTRKRMIGVQRTLKIESKNYRAFEVLNLGKYERQYYVGINPSLREEQQQQQIETKEQEFLALILRAYSAEKINGFASFQGKKAGRMVAIGPVNMPVSRSLVEAIIDECVKNKITKVDLLGFEFEMGLFPNLRDEAKTKGIDLAPKYIPAEVFDKRAVEKNEVVFYDVAFIEAKAHINGNSVAVELTDFSVLPQQNTPDSIREALKDWRNWVDYWAVDFDFESKKEIIRVEDKDTGAWTEEWTGDFVFENEWQSFRTKQNRDLELQSVYHECQKGNRKIAVKVVDIFGNDTMTILEVTIGGSK